MPNKNGMDFEKLEVKVVHLRPTMVLSGDCYDEFGNMIKDAHTPFTQEEIDDLRSRNIKSLYYTPKEDEEINKTADKFFKETDKKALEYVDKPTEKVAISFDKLEKGVKKVKDVSEEVKKNNAITSQISLELKSIVAEFYSDLKKNKVALIHLVHLKNLSEHNYAHSVNVASLSLMIAEFLRLPEESIINVGFAAIMHDIGKVKISEDIVNKPDNLTDEEYETMKKHSVYSYEILKTDKVLDDTIVEGVLFHHENHNGSGYPKGLHEHLIPLFAQIIHIADVYDAMTSSRPQRKALSVKEAIWFILEKTNIMFNSKVATAFIKCLIKRIKISSLFDKGSYVLLNTGEIARIKRERQSDLIRPAIEIIRDNTKKFKKIPLETDLSLDAHREIVKLIRDDKTVDAIEKVLSSL